MNLCVEVTKGFFMPYDTPQSILQTTAQAPTTQSKVQIIIRPAFPYEKTKPLALNLWMQMRKAQNTFWPLMSVPF